MARDIDYAAIAVKTAMVEKFGRQNDLSDLSLLAHERTISVQHGPHKVAGTRDDLLAAVRAADNYEEFWQRFPTSRTSAE